MIKLGMVVFGNYSKKYFEDCYKKEKDFWSRGELPKLFNKFIRLVKEGKGKKILDLGCGTGRVSLILGQEGFKVFGADYSFLAIKQAKKALRKGSENVVFIKGNILNYRFPINKFDAAVDIGTLHHIPKKFWDRYVKQLKKTLKLGGFVYLRLFSMNTRDHFGFSPRIKQNWHIHQGHYDHFFSKEEIKNLFKDFEIVDFQDLTEGTAKDAPVIHSYINCILKLINT